VAAVATNLVSTTRWSELVMARVAAIACGYEDGNDLYRLRHDPLMKIAVGAPALRRGSCHSRPGLRAPIARNNRLTARCEI
jgi:hypothetical protein